MLFFFQDALPSLLEVYAKKASNLDPDITGSKEMDKASKLFVKRCPL